MTKVKDYTDSPLQQDMRVLDPKILRIGGFYGPKHLQLGGF